MVAAAAPRACPRESGRGFRCCDCGAVNMAVSLRARSLRHLRIRGKGLRAGRGDRLCVSVLPPPPHHHRHGGSPSTPVPSRPLPSLPAFLLLGFLPPRRPNALLFPRPRRSERQRRGERPPRSQPRYGLGVAACSAPAAEAGWGGAGRRRAGKPPAARSGLVLRGGHGGSVGGEAKRERGAAARRRWAARRPVVSGAARRWKPLLSPRLLRGSGGTAGPCRSHRAGLPGAQARGSPCALAEAARPFLGLFSEEAVACRRGCLQRPTCGGASRAAPVGLARGAPSGRGWARLGGSAVHLRAAVRPWRLVLPPSLVEYPCLF